MKNKYTVTILKYIYKELALTDHLEVEFAIQEEKSWKSEYNLLNEAYQLLPRVNFFPKNSVVKNIMGYSARTAA